MRWRDSATPLVVMLVLAFVTTTGSFLSKSPCSGPPYNDAGISENIVNAWRLLCMTDIQYLWVGRGIDQHDFPYVHGRLDPGDGPPGLMVDGALEYPVLTGVFMWATALPAHNSGEFQAYTALALMPVALLIGWQLATLVGWRGLVYAAAPALIFYSVYNWDLLPVAWTLGAILAWRRGRYGWAAALLGLGAATKLYPGFFLLPLLIERLVARDRRGALTVAGAGAGSWLAVNAPFMAINFDGWWATYAFQAARIPDNSTNSIYFWGFPEWPIEHVNQVSVTLIATAWVIALVVGYLLRDGERYPWIQVSASMLFSFLAFNKVYSPQYALWVLPFLALIAVRWGWWVAYWCVDATLFIGLFRWYHDFGDARAHQAAYIGGWSKSVLLALLAFVVLVTPLALRRETNAGGVWRRSAVEATMAATSSRSRWRGIYSW
jgi:uncharacterized membrane protein